MRFSTICCVQLTKQDDAVLVPTTEVHLVSVHCNLWSTDLANLEEKCSIHKIWVGTWCLSSSTLKRIKLRVLCNMLCAKSSKERTNWRSLVNAFKSSRVEETAQISYFQGTEGIHSLIIILTIHQPIHNQLTHYNCCGILYLVEGLDPWGYDRPKLVFWDFFVQVDDQFWTKFATMH